MSEYDIDEETRKTVEILCLPDAYDYIHTKLEIAYVSGRLKEVRAKAKELKAVES